MTAKRGAQPGSRLPELGRYDRSFFIRMVVSFLAFTLALVLVELGLRFGLVLYEFRRSGEETRVAAERLAGDVRSIMLNRGGPVAARTVYPILQRNFQRAGLEIAIEPSEVTRTSIRKTLGFVPEGVHSAWPSGTYNEGRVELRAEEFCLQCHTDASVGAVLGTVTTRSYLSTRLEGWWKDVRLTAGLNLLTVVIHSVILFFLLRVLLAPLFSLRSAVSQLAKGAADLSTRAEVRSSDEFGELANDLNAFLDRIDHILADLQGTIAKTVAVSTRLAQVTGRTGDQLERVERSLEAVLAAPGADQAAVARILQEVHEFRHMIQQLGFLEEHLNDVAEAGQRLLDRLRGRREALAEAGAAE